LPYIPGLQPNDACPLQAMTASQTNAKPAVPPFVPVPFGHVKELASGSRVPFHITVVSQHDHRLIYPVRGVAVCSFCGSKGDEGWKLKGPYATILAPLATPCENGGLAVHPFFVCCAKNFLRDPDMSEIDALPLKTKQAYLAQLTRYAEDWFLPHNWDSMRAAQMLTQDSDSAVEEKDEPTAEEKDDAFVPKRDATAGTVLANIACGASGMDASYLKKLPATTVLTIQAYLPLQGADSTAVPPNRDQDFVQFQVTAKDFIQQCLGRVAQGADGGPVEVDAWNLQLPPVPVAPTTAVTQEGEQASGSVPSVPEPAVVPTANNDATTDRQREQQEILDMPRWCLWIASQTYGQSHALLTQCHKAQSVHAYARRINRPV
jgi:hypothetical protein